MTKKTNEIDISTEIIPDQSTDDVDNSVVTPVKQYLPNSREMLLKSAVRFSKPSKTVKSAAYETDLNNMVKGLTPYSISNRTPFYIDETIFPDNYEAHYNAILEAEAAFMSLPADVREKFKNDPRELVDALNDPSKHEWLISIGVLASDNNSGTSATGGPEAPQGSEGPSDGSSNDG